MSVVSVDTETGEVLSGQVVEEFSVEEALAHTDKINHAVGFAGALVVEAWERRIWTTLGYPSWEDYCESKLSVEEQSPASRAALMVGLRKAGASYRAIASASGQSVGKVHKDLAGVHDVNTSAVTGTDGKQYDPAQPSKIRRSETVEFAGEAPDREAGGVHDAIVEDETSPALPEVEPVQSVPSDDPVEDAGSTRPHPPTGSPDDSEHDAAVARLARSVAQAHDLFRWKPEDIHALNDPDSDSGIAELMKRIEPWWETYKATKPTGLVVHQGGKA